MALITNEARLETAVVSALVICGELSGESLLTWCLYGMSDQLDARKEMMRLSKVLVQMQRNGHVQVRQSGGATLWKLVPEAGIDWVNDRLLISDVQEH
jgi:hypothetical protein